MANSPRNALFESLVNVRHTVLGRTLHSLCLRHFLWLEHINSPLIGGSRPATLKDLELAVIVCSNSSDELTLRDLEAGGIAAAVWRWRNRRWDFPGELEKFLSYYGDYLALPDFYEHENCKTSAIPHLLSHAASLIKNTGWTQDVVFNMPLGTLIWLNIAFGYLESGECNIVSEAEQKAAEYLSKLTSRA